MDITSRRTVSITPPWPEPSFLSQNACIGENLGVLNQPIEQVRRPGLTNSENVEVGQTSEAVNGIWGRISRCPVRVFVPARIFEILQEFFRFLEIWYIVWIYFKINEIFLSLLLPTCMVSNWYFPTMMNLLFFGFILWKHYNIKFFKIFKWKIYMMLF